MPTFKVLFVFNNNKWTTIPEKLAGVKAFFASKMVLNIDTVYTHYANIPFTTVATSDGSSGKELPGTSETVDDRWYDANITALAKGYDIVVFCITDQDKIDHLTASGIRGDNAQGPVECIIFGGVEGDHGYNQGVDQGNYFTFISCHEISHALFMILGGTDCTHEYFYSQNPKAILSKYVFPVPNQSDRITKIQILLDACLKLLGLYRQQQAMLTPIIDPSKPDMVTKFCKAIENREGSIAPGTVFKYGVDQYPKGTPAWRNKNPGNLRYANQKGSIGKDPSNFAIFPDYTTGFAALYHQVYMACNGQSNVFKPTDTVLQFFQKYAPATDNNEPHSYAQEVAHYCGITIDTKMKDLI